MKQILIVDDDEMMRTLSCFWLKKAGYRCLEAANADEAREMAVSHQPDLIIMDCYLAHESGVMVTQGLKRDYRTKDIPILAMTADPYMRSAFMEAGAEAYLTKPFQQQTFLVRVVALLEAVKSR
jgi:two-component system, OmpR family, phosphate regulon response regulator PhoB